jgi:hypothetical protein
MPARVSIDAKAWGDVRFDVLARELGVDRYSAIGRMAAIWGECTDRETQHLPASVIAMHLGCARGDVVEILCHAAELAEDTPDGIRLRGAGGRIEWLGDRRARASAGGKARALAPRSQGGKFVSQTAAHQPLTSQRPAIDQPATSKEPAMTSPPTPALTLIQEEDTHVSAKRAGQVLGEMATDWLNAHLGKTGSGRFGRLSACAHKAGARWRANGWSLELVTTALAIRIAELRRMGNHAYLTPATLYNTKLAKYVEMAQQGTTPEAFARPLARHGVTTARAPTRAQLAGCDGERY